MNDLKSDLGKFSGGGAVIGSCPVALLPLRQTSINGFLLLHWVKEGLQKGGVCEGIRWTQVLEISIKSNESCQGSGFRRNNGVLSCVQDIGIFWSGNIDEEKSGWLVVGVRRIIVSHEKIL